MNIIVQRGRREIGGMEKTEIFAFNLHFTRVFGRSPGLDHGLAHHPIRTQQVWLCSVFLRRRTADRTGDKYLFHIDRVEGVMLTAKLTIDADAALFRQQVVDVLASQHV